LILASAGAAKQYALWRSVYAVKQVDARSRVLVLIDYLKTRIWGRDISQF
jgi:NADH:ubiquinone reductase (non-electrogenic)